MNISLKEHDFIQVRNRIYRIFGYEHPRGKYFSLLRYWRESRNSPWVKPPVNAAENGKHEVLFLYNSKLVEYEPYGIKLALFDAAEIDKIFDSTNINQFKNSKAIKIYSIIKTYCKYYGIQNNRSIQVSLVGSNLVGISNSSSDVDIVFYGIRNEREAINFVKPLFAEIGDYFDKSYAGVPGKYVSDTIKFIKKSGITNLSKTSRAVFGTCFTGGKIDIYYVEHACIEKINCPINARTISQQTRFVGIVVQCEKRIYFPPILTIKIGKQERDVIFLNHEAKFLINGDVIEFVAIEKVIENNVSKRWIEGTSVLLAINLISCNKAVNGEKYGSSEKFMGNKIKNKAEDRMNQEE